MVALSNATCLSVVNAYIVAALHHLSQVVNPTYHIQLKVAAAQCEFLKWRVCENWHLVIKELLPD